MYQFLDNPILRGILTALMSVLLLSVLEWIFIPLSFETTVEAAIIGGIFGAIGPWMEAKIKTILQ